MKVVAKRETRRSARAFHDSGNVRRLLYVGSLQWCDVQTEGGREVSVRNVDASRDSQYCNTLKCGATRDHVQFCNIVLMRMRIWE